MPSKQSRATTLGGAERAAPSQRARDWRQLEEWDRRYYLHSVQAQAEYVFVGVERTDGNYLELADGSKLLDFQSQLISDSMGHRHPRVHSEIRAAMERYGHVYFGFATDYRARAAKLILEDVLGSEEWAGRVRFLSSGTEAVECALAMARHYTRRPLVLTQAHSYHGMSPGATYLRGYRGQLSPGDRLDEIYDIPGFPSAGFALIPAPESHGSACRGSLASLDMTESIIQSLGPENIACVITETMLGAAGILSHDEYLPGLRQLCDRYDILWVSDEVLTGFGRLGEWFSYQYYENAEPDLMTIGKGVNGCALPVGGVIARRDIAEFFDRARWWSGSTHDAHPLVCASIVGNLEAMIADDILTRVKELGEYLRAGLVRLASSHFSVGRVSGRGLYFALDLVNRQGNPIVTSDRATGFTGDLSDHPNHIIGRECFKRGVFLGGFMPNTLKCAPPFTIAAHEIDHGLEVLDAALYALEDVLAGAAEAIGDGGAD